MQQIMFATSKVSEQEAESFASPTEGATDGPCEIDNSGESRNDLYRCSHIDQSRCSFKHYPKDTSVLVGHPFNLQVSRALRQNYGAFVLGSDQNFSEDDKGFKLSEVCLAYICGKCQDPIGCHRVHVAIKASDISSATALVHGLSAYPMVDRLRTYTGTSSSSGNYPGFRDARTWLSNTDVPFSPRKELVFDAAEDVFQEGLRGEVQPPHPPAHVILCLLDKIRPPDISARATVCVSKSSRRQRARALWSSSPNVRLMQQKESRCLTTAKPSSPQDCRWNTRSTNLQAKLLPAREQLGLRTVSKLQKQKVLPSTEAKGTPVWTFQRSRLFSETKPVPRHLPQTLSGKSVARSWQSIKVCQSLTCGCVS